MECHVLAMKVEEVSKPCMEFALDAICRAFGEQSWVTECIECSRYVERDGPDPMSDNVGSPSIHCWESKSILSKVE